MATNICPPLKRLFEEVNTGRPLDYTPKEMANEFALYINDLEGNPMRVKTKFAKHSNKKQVMRNSEEKLLQDKEEELPRAPRVTDFVVRWLGKDMTWWSKLSNADYHPGTHQAFSHVKYHIQQYCRCVKLNGALVGVFNANIISRELGLMDKQMIEQKSTQVVIQVNNEEEAKRMKELADMV